MDGAGDKCVAGINKEKVNKEYEILKVYKTHDKPDPPAIKKVHDKSDQSVVKKKISAVAVLGTENACEQNLAEHKSKQPPQNIHKSSKFFTKLPS